jgi:hypothetical protein
VLDYSLLFYVFQFFLGEASVCPWAVLEYFPGGWVGELHMVHDAHLFILQFHASSFGAGWQEEMACFFSEWCGAGRLSMG